MRYLLLLFSVALLHATPEDSAQLTVTGEAVISKPADQVSITIGVVTEAEDAQVALDDNHRRMSRVMNALDELDLESSDMETTQFQLIPRYTVRPQPTPENWKPAIVGYQVINSIVLTTMQIKQLGHIIDVVNEVGANRIDAIRFSLKDPRQYRAEVIAAATKNALKDAQNLATAAGVKLGRLLLVSLDQTQPTPMKSVSFRLEAAPSFEEGEIAIHATVHLVFALLP